MSEISKNRKIRINGTAGTSMKKNDDVTRVPEKLPSFKNNGKKKEEEETRDEAKDHISELAALVDWANRECEKNDSHYRFRLRAEKEDVYIDVVIADAEGKIKAIMAREITHEDVLRTVEHIREGEGILFDRKG